MKILTRNLTKGEPGKIILLFALPMLFGNIFQQMYNMVDSVVVGNFVGADALAAVGSSYTITFGVTALAFGLGNGASILIGQYFGAGRSREARHSIVTSMTFAILFSLVLLVACIFLCAPLLRLVNMPKSIFPMSMTYMRIYFLGLVFTFAYNMLSSVFRALGDSKTPLIFLIVASVVNIVLDLVFVINFKMGVAGVAWATIIAQAVSSVLALVALRRRLADMQPQDPAYAPESHETFRQQLSLPLLKKMIRLAIPTTAQEIAISGGMIIMQAFVNGYGPRIMAAYTAAAKIESLAMMPIINISTAVTSYAAQNMGAGEIERVKSGYRASLRISFVFAAVLGGAIVLFGHSLVGIFVSGEGAAEVAAAGANYLLYSAFAFIFMALLFPAEGVMKGTGDVNFFMLFAIVGIVAKVTAALTLSPAMGYTGLWLAVVIGWGCEAVCTTLRYLSGKWKTKGIIQHPVAAAETAAEQ